MKAIMTLTIIRDCFKRLFSNKKNVLAELSVLLSVITIYFIASYVLLERDSRSLVYYGDAISHLVIARQIFDSIQPGLIQLGSAWLPMTHLLLLPFVSIDVFFHTGFAGTIVSSTATGITAVMLFRIVRTQFGCSIPIGMLASGLYITNPSVIYMGIIPMMEAPFMMFFMISVYYLQKFCRWYMITGLHKTNDNNNNNNTLEISAQYSTLTKASLAISAASLTRYEGWLFPFGFILVILVVLFVITKSETSRKISRKILPLSVPISFGGMVLWLYY